MPWGCSGRQDRRGHRNEEDEEKQKIRDEESRRYEFSFRMKTDHLSHVAVVVVLIDFTLWDSSKFTEKWNDNAEFP